MPEEDLLDRPETDTKVPLRSEINDSLHKRSSPTSGQPDKESSNSTNISTESSIRARLLNSDLVLNQRQEMIRIVSNRLFVALSVLMVLTIAGGYLLHAGHLTAGATNLMVMFCGAIGGFISLQRRLKTFQQDDLTLLARSWVYVLLSPLVGGILALLLFFMFISGLLAGDLFPNFVPVLDAVNSGNALATAAGNTEAASSYTGLSMLFSVQGQTYEDYGKIIFWCFLAGYSESFVTNIISNFESKGERSSASN